MINQLQHIMILGLYTVFSIFLAIISIVISDSFSTGVLGFFITFLLCACGHIFWIGKEVVSKITLILYDVEDGTNLYQQELKTVRDIIDNITNIINTMINDNEQIQENIDSSHQELSEHIDNSHQELMKSLEELSKKVTQLETTQEDCTNQLLKMKKLSQKKNYIYEPFDLEQPLDLDDPIDLEKPLDLPLSEKDNPHNNDTYNQEDDFLNITNDDSFSNITFPPQKDILNQQENNFKHLTVNNIDHEEEFTVVEPVSPSLDNSDFYDPDNQPRQTIKENPLEKIHTKQTSQDIAQKNETPQMQEKAEPNNQTQLENQLFTLENRKISIPALTDLIPLEDDVGSKKENIKPILRGILPSLQALLDKKAKKTNVKQEEQNSPNSSEKKILKNNLQKSESPFDTLANKEMSAIINKALENNDIDIYIRPISDLRSNDVKFFEAYPYLNHQDMIIPPEKFMPIAYKDNHHIEFDRFLVKNSIKIIREIIYDIPNASIFCNLSVNSFINEQFSDELAGLIKENIDVSRHLIFEFSQDNLQFLNSMGIETLRSFKNYGVRFSLDKIHSILPDLDELSKIGISFIKILPSDFDKGINSNGITLRDNDIKQMCQNSNIMLCVEGINRADDLNLTKPFMPDLLQGDLLGEIEPANQLMAIE